MTIPRSVLSTEEHCRAAEVAETLATLGQGDLYLLGQGFVELNALATWLSAQLSEQCNERDRLRRRVKELEASR